MLDKKPHVSRRQLERRQQATSIVMTSWAILRELSVLLDIDLLDACNIVRKKWRTIFFLSSLNARSDAIYGCIQFKFNNESILLFFLRKLITSGTTAFSHFSVLHKSPHVTGSTQDNILFHDIWLPEIFSIMCTFPEEAGSSACQIR